MPIRPSVLRARAAARPRPIRRTLLARVRSIYVRVDAEVGQWQAGYLAVLGVLAWWTIEDSAGHRLALTWWIVGGVQAWIAGTWLKLDARRRRDRHDRSGLPTIRGWRLATGLPQIDPELLLAIDLFIYLFDHAKLTAVPIRGRRRRMRTTYEVSLRELARQSWARSRGVSGRRAEHLLAEQLCRRLGLVRLVPVGTATAYRLVDESIQAGLCRMERSVAQPLIAWRLGRDPRWDDVPHAEVARA